MLERYLPPSSVGIHAHALSTRDGHERALLQSLGLDDAGTLGSVDTDLVPDDGPVLDREGGLGRGTGLDELEVSRDLRGLVSEETGLVAGHPAGRGREKNGKVSIGTVPYRLAKGERAKRTCSSRKPVLAWP